MQAAFEDVDEALVRDAAHLKETPLRELAGALRQAKRRMALLTGLMDLGGVWTLEVVTGALTEFAGIACNLALKAGLAPQLARGKVPGQGEEVPEDAAGMFVLAMGKMGAGELNYSSDIDLICLFDETGSTRTTTTRRAPPSCARRGAWRRSCRDVHRRRLRLPHRSAAAARSGRHAGLHGDGGGRELLREPRPHLGTRGLYQGAARAPATSPPASGSWRRCALRLAQAPGFRGDPGRARHAAAHPRAQGAGRAEQRLPGHNMKLGRGGIREIEFFTQTRQLIAGGRDPILRMRGTVEGLARAGREGLDPAGRGRDAQRSLPLSPRGRAPACRWCATRRPTSCRQTAEEIRAAGRLMGRDTDALLQGSERPAECGASTLTEGFFAPSRGCGRVG